MGLKPIGKKIVVQVFNKPEETVAGGIIVTTKADRAEYREGIIQMVGPGYEGDLRPGDTVLLAPFIGTEVVLNKERLVILRPEEIPAVIEE